MVQISRKITFKALEAFSYLASIYVMLYHAVYSMPKKGVLLLRCKCQFTGYSSLPLQNVNIHRNTGNDVIWYFIHDIHVTKSQYRKVHYNK